MELSWLIDESAHAGAEHLDPIFVTGYDTKQAADPSPDVEALLAHGVGASSTVVDLGAGTGGLAVALAPYVHHLIAVDVSPAMVAHLRTRTAELDLDNVQVVRAGFLGYEHTGPPVDAIHSRNALHQLPDFWKVMALDRMATILRPGGVLRLRDLILDCEPQQTIAVVEDWLAGAVDDPVHGYTRGDFVEHLTSEFSTYRWLLEPMLDHAGFDIVDTRFHRSVYGAYTCVRRAT